MEQIETCRTSGHVWRKLLGGKRCGRCGEQRAAAVNPIGAWSDKGFFGDAPDRLIEAYIAASEGSDLPEIIRADGHTFRRMGCDIPDAHLDSVLQLSNGKITVIA